MGEWGAETGGALRFHAVSLPRSLSSHHLSMASITVVDPPGFQNPRHQGKERAATFEELCHNYAHERLQLLFHRRTFVSALERHREVRPGGVGPPRGSRRAGGRRGRRGRSSHNRWLPPVGLTANETLAPGLVPPGPLCPIFLGRPAPTHGPCALRSRDARDVGLPRPCSHSRPFFGATCPLSPLPPAEASSSRKPASSPAWEALHAPLWGEDRRFAHLSGQNVAKKSQMQFCFWELCVSLGNMDTCLPAFLFSLKIKFKLKYNIYTGKGISQMRTAR